MSTATRRWRSPSRRPVTPRCRRTTSSARSPRERARASTPTRSRRSCTRAYGPGGVALLIEALTDNRNRTGADVRHLLAKHGGNLGEPGSVSYLFDKQGVIVVDANRYDEDDLMRGDRRRSAGHLARRRRVRGDHRARRPRVGQRCAHRGAASRSRAPTCRSVRSRGVPARRGRCGQADQADRRARGVRRRQRGPRELRRRRRRARADRLGRSNSVARRPRLGRCSDAASMSNRLPLALMHRCSRSAGRVGSARTGAGVTACGSSSSSSTAGGDHHTLDGATTPSTAIRPPSRRRRTPRRSRRSRS